MNRQQTIAIDLDDVLAAGAEAFIAFSNQRWGTSLTVDDFTERWADVWGVDIQEERKRAIEIYDSGLLGKLRTLDRAKPVLAELAKNYRLVVMTSRVRRIQQDTLDWVDQHYRGIFDDIHFSGFYDKITEHSHLYTKAELAREIGADYLIDDQPKHCIASAEAGIKSLLFGEYFWNKKIDLPPGVTRVKNWAEVEEYFARKS